MPDCSRGSVAASPLRTSAAISTPCAASVARAGSQVLAEHPPQHGLHAAAVQVGGVQQGAPAAPRPARSSGPTRPGRPPGRAAPAMARASTSDSSQVVAETTGDQRSRVTPPGGGTVPLGSSSQQRPDPARPRAVAARTVGLGRGDHHRSGRGQDVGDRRPRWSFPTAADRAPARRAGGRPGPGLPAWRPGRAARRHSPGSGAAVRVRVRLSARGSSWARLVGGGGGGSRTRA